MKHVTIDGESIEIADMTNSQLINTINHKLKHTHLSCAYFMPFVVEAWRRDIPPTALFVDALSKKAEREIVNGSPDIGAGHPF